MLDALTPEEFDERWRADSLDPIDESWYQTGVICAAIVNAINTIAAGLGGSRLGPDDVRKPEDYIPKLDLPDKKPPRQTVDRIQQRWKAIASGGSR
jgi:hypothetical protein